MENQIKNNLDYTFPWFIEGISDTLEQNGFNNNILSAYAQLKSEEKLSLIGDFLWNVISGFGEGLKSFISDIFEFVRDVIKKVGHSLERISLPPFSPALIFNSLKAAIDNFEKSIKSFANISINYRKIILQLYSEFKLFKTSLIKFSEKLKIELKKIPTSLPRAIRDNAYQIGSSLCEVILSINSGEAKGDFKSFINSIGYLLGNLIFEVGSFFIPFPGVQVLKGVKWLQRLKNFGSKGFKILLNILSSMWEKILKNLSPLFKLLKLRWKSLISFLKTIMRKTGTVANKISTVNLSPTQKLAIEKMNGGLLANTLKVSGKLGRKLFSKARKEFKALRNGYAERLGIKLGSGGQVHHAIELQVLKRYGSVFSIEELNDFKNMRGIPAELVKKGKLAGKLDSRKGAKQLHNSAIRRIWDETYERLRVIEETFKSSDKGLTKKAKKLIRAEIENTRDYIDWKFDFLYSENKVKALSQEIGKKAVDELRTLSSL